MGVHHNPRPRPIMPRYGEGSDLRSERDGASIQRQWSRNQELAKQIDWLTQAVKDLQWQLNRLRLRKGGDATDATSLCPYG